MSQSSEPSAWIAEVVAPLPPLCSMQQVGTALQMSRRNLGRLVSLGRIKGLRATESGSSRIRIPRSEVVRYLQSLEADS